MSRQASKASTHLEAIDREAESRSWAVRALRPDWPCRAGCSACCRALARPMQLHPIEWVRVDAALDALPEAEAYRERLMRWTEQGPNARECPLLHLESGRCQVYAARPLACRTYGFYVAEDGEGRWCDEIARRSDLDGIVFGHEGSVLRRMGRQTCDYRGFRAKFETESVHLCAESHSR